MSPAVAVLAAARVLPAVMALPGGGIEGNY